MGTLKTRQVYISRGLCLLDLKTRVCVPTRTRCSIARGLLLTRQIAAFLCCSTSLYFNFPETSIHSLF